MTYYKKEWEQSLSEKNDEIQTLKSKLDKAEKALKFYAYEDEWSDNGQIARKTLEEIK